MKMNYNVYYIVIGLIAVLNTVKGITMTKKEVLDIKLGKYKTKESCPEYGDTSDALYLYDCSFTFYCIDDNNCQSDSNFTSPYFYFTEKDNTVKKYIKQYCLVNPSYKDYVCHTEKCLSDSDCLSNNCKNNTCYQGDSLFTECSDFEDADYFNYGHHKMKCGKIHGSVCAEHDECAGKCTGDKICESHESLVPTAPIHIELIFIPIIAAMILCCICCCICCCRESRKNRK